MTPPVTIAPRVLWPVLLPTLVLLLMGAPGLGQAGEKPAHSFKDAQAAYDQRHYDQALALVEPFTQDGGQGADALRLKARILVRLGRPVDALPVYDQVAAKLGRDDGPLLHDLAFAFIVAVLKDMREQMRGAGYTALKEVQSNSNEAIPHFLDGLSDGSGLVRALAAEGLGRMKPGPHTARLKKALEDRAAMVRVVVLKALGRSGDRAQIPVVEQALKDEQATVRVAASGALVMLGRSEAWNQVRELAEAQNPEDRAAALRMLGDLGDRRALPLLRQALVHTQPSVRGAAATALGDLKDPAAAPDLVAALRDPIPGVRASVAVSLGEVAAPESAAALKDSLLDPNPAVRAASVSALLRLGTPFKDVVDTVMALTRNTDPGIRASVGRALAQTHGKSRTDAVEVLRLLLEDPLPRPRIAAARSLGQLSSPELGQEQLREIIGILKIGLKDKDEAVRATVGGALIRALTAAAPVQPAKGQ
ncbi:MAG: HEAT repeat domain-containing protein [Nitrospirota bacterium]|nr:HEAT repeat domain-containing protein [Nitrospirota bacterium]